MVVVQDVFQAKYGKDDELVQLFKESNDCWPGEGNFQIVPDLSGPYATVVTKTVCESPNVYEAILQQAISDPCFAEWFERIMPLVNNGGREYYTLVD